MKRIVVLASVALCCTAARGAAPDRKREVVAGLMGTTMFVSRHCTAFEVNPDKLATFLKGAGATDRNDADVLDLAAAAKVERDLEAQGPTADSCQALWRRFGPTGSVGARLLRPR